MTEKIFLLCKKSMAIFIIVLISNSLNAQILDKISLEGEGVTKFSVGKETRNNINFADNSTINVPEKSTFDNPVLGLNFTIMYDINENFSTGVGSGINIILNQRNPVTSSTTYDKVLLPLYLKFGYEKQIFSKWIFLTDIYGGFQYSEFSEGSSTSGFYFKEKGGLLANINFGIGKNLENFNSLLKLGYELNQFKNIGRLGIGDETSIFNELIEYKTYYHLIKLSFVIQI